MIKKFCYSVVFMMICLASATYGQQKVVVPSESDRNSSNRDIIKYLARVELGLGYGVHTLDELTFTGLAVPMDIQIGIGILPKTYVHGAFGVSIMDRPTYTTDNSTYEGTLAMFDVGAGLTMYPFKQKIYGSGTIYATTMAAFVDEDVYNSDVGIAFNLKGGIDLMLGSALSVGVSAFFYYAGMNDKSDEYGNQPRINNTVIGLCLTATLGNL